MQSHEDSDFLDVPLRRGFVDTPERQKFRESFLKQLSERADYLQQTGRAKITGGVDGEPILEEWTAENGIYVRRMPADPQGILRISVGGGDHLPVTVNYLTFRGERGQCIDLLRRALKALENDPQ